MRHEVGEEHAAVVGVRLTGMQDGEDAPAALADKGEQRSNRHRVGVRGPEERLQRRRIHGLVVVLRERVVCRGVAHVHHRAHARDELHQLRALQVPRAQDARAKHAARGLCAICGRRARGRRLKGVPHGALPGGVRILRWQHFQAQGGTRRLPPVSGLNKARRSARNVKVLPRCRRHNRGLKDVQQLMGTSSVSLCAGAVARSMQDLTVTHQWCIEQDPRKAIASQWKRSLQRPRWGRPQHWGLREEPSWMSWLRLGQTQAVWATGHTSASALTTLTRQDRSAGRHERAHFSGNVICRSMSVHGAFPRSRASRFSTRCVCGRCNGPRARAGVRRALIFFQFEFAARRLAPAGWESTSEARPRIAHVYVGRC